MIINISPTDDLYALKVKLEAFAEELLMGDFVGDYEIRIEKPKITDKQMRALYLYFDLLAEHLNDAGITRNKFFAALKSEMRWNSDSIKTQVWHELQQARGIPRTTTKLKRPDIDLIHNDITLFLGTRFGIENVDFPSIEDLFPEHNNN